ncbi:uncharacterized protein si:dkey-1h24.6 [Betta splendens]|uniref:Uncharacterized protein si:dkey-1h24.6 n=1 Tax=Betta splendens TaxID=158456 RepID=A0A6P7PT90_BETSP|nr:uncharacterized protein si:dkey-1h24.6 [Betta splendens]
MRDGLEALHSAGGTFTRVVSAVKMGLCWRFVVLLCCSVSEAALSHGTCVCKGTLEAVREAGGEVHVPCPNVDGEIKAFDLFKDDALMSTTQCNKTSDGTGLDCTQSKDNVIMHETQPLSISFVLTNHSQGIYKCKGKVIFPPPYKKIPSEVQVHVVELQYKTDQNRKPELPWIWIVAVSVFIIYSVTLTIIALVYWRKLKTLDSQSDYMNTKPRAPRGFKKRGVQNPMPRYI